MVHAKKVVAILALVITHSIWPAERMQLTGDEFRCKLKFQVDDWQKEIDLDLTAFSEIDPVAKKFFQRPGETIMVSEAEHVEVDTSKQRFAKFKIQNLFVDIKDGEKINRKQRTCLQLVLINRGFKKTSYCESLSEMYEHELKTWTQIPEGKLFDKNHPGLVEVGHDKIEGHITTHDLRCRHLGTIQFSN